MSTIFEGVPLLRGIRGDQAKVTHIEGRVLLRASDTMAEDAVMVAFTPDQADTLADAIRAAAVRAREGGE